MAISFSNQSYAGGTWAFGSVYGTTPSVYAFTKDLSVDNAGAITINGTLNGPGTGNGTVTVSGVPGGYGGSTYYWMNAGSDGLISNGGIMLRSTLDGSRLYISNDPLASQLTTVGTHDNSVLLQPVSDSASFPCFAAGTRILTARGEVAVEALAEGDLVATFTDGAMPFRPVIWIGHGTLDLAHHPHLESMQPIRIAAGALGVGAPSRDLLVSPDHAMLLDGALVPAKLLVNGETITRETRPRSITYYHVELDRHDAVLAEGALAESYLETGNRHAFRNALTAAVPLFPRFPLAAAHSAWQTEACAPLVVGGPRLPGIRRKLAERLRAAGLAPEGDADPRLILPGGAVLRPRREGDTLVFALPLTLPGAPVLASRVVAPAELHPAAADPRPLGLAVASLACDDSRLPADSAALEEAPGFGRLERDSDGAFRWTDGLARLPPRFCRPGGTLRVQLRDMGLRYWAPARADRRASA